MDPSRKRKIRLVVALAAALLLAGALLVTSFGTATAAKTPSQVLAAGGGGPYELTGKVVPGTIRQHGEGLIFRVSDRTGARSVPVAYEGIVSDTFRGGREIIVKGSLEHGTFVGQRDTLTTKCPSKFQDKKSAGTL
jgi:cytochrome c-type biogenesis protein CcmE